MSDTATGTDTDYAALRLWERRMGSNAAFLADQLAMARRERAPWNAIYRRNDGWRTTDDITNLGGLDDLGIPEQSRRRNTVMRHQIDVAALRDALEGMAQKLRAFGGCCQGLFIRELAEMLDMAAGNCDAVASQLGVAIETFPPQQRHEVEPAVRERLRQVRGA